MGSVFSSKKKKAAPEPEKPRSAPARLEGLDGTEPDNVKDRRAITPPGDSSRGLGDGSGNLSPGKPKPKKIDFIGKQSDGAGLAAALPVAITIPEDASAWTKVFGQPVVRNLFSADWKDREQGLQSVARFLAGPECGKHDAAEVYVAAAQIAERFMKLGLQSVSITLVGPECGKHYTAEFSAAAAQIAERFVKDKVAPLYHASLELLRAMLATFCKKVPQEKLHAGMEPIMPMLLNRCGNLNTRMRDHLKPNGYWALLAIAGASNFGTGYVGPYALAPMPPRAKAASASAQMYGRLDLVYGLLSNYCLAGSSTAGLGMKEVMAFAKQGLEIPDEKVRSCAIKVVVEMYRIEHAAGRDLEPERYLGPLKPALLQILHRQFDEARTEMSGGAMATGISIKAPKGSLPPLGGGGGGRGGLPPLGGNTKLRGSINSLAQASGKSGTGEAGTPAGKPPRKPFQRPPPGRGGLPDIPPMAEGGAARSIDGVMTDTAPMRNPSPSGKNLRAQSPNLSSQNSYTSAGRRSLAALNFGATLHPTYPPLSLATPLGPWTFDWLMKC
eukprot:gene4083-14183_t